MEQIPAQRRPHCPPVERLAILELRAARAYSLSQAARHFQVSTATIASWTDRLDEQGSCNLEAKIWTSDGVGGGTLFPPPSSIPPRLRGTHGDWWGVTRTTS